MVELIHEQITSEIISSAFEVNKNLGVGFLEKVYENSLKKELELRGFNVKSQQTYNVLYKGYNVGLYQTDLLVNEKVIVEVKCTDCIAPIHNAQLLNYLKTTNLQIGLIINFGKIKVEFKRVAFIA